MICPDNGDAWFKTLGLKPDNEREFIAQVSQQVFSGLSMPSNSEVRAAIILGAIEKGLEGFCKGLEKSSSGKGDNGFDVDLGVD